jgi:hypothetical protein
VSREELKTEFEKTLNGNMIPSSLVWYNGKYITWLEDKVIDQAKRLKEIQDE